MDGAMPFLTLAGRGEGDALLASVNGRLAAAGLSLKHDDMLVLAQGRVDALQDTGRVEFGVPAIVTVAEAIATSPHVMQEDVAGTLAKLQGVFYALREELPPDVPDSEIAAAIRGCLDAWGSADEVVAMPADEVMAYSDEYVRAREAEVSGGYRITDDEGRTYTFDPAEWDYDEQADGWDGERWGDDWDDWRA